MGEEGGRGPEFKSFKISRQIMLRKFQAKAGCVNILLEQLWDKYAGLDKIPGIKQIPEC